MSVNVPSDVKHSTQPLTSTFSASSYALRMICSLFIGKPFLFDLNKLRFGSMVHDRRMVQVMPFPSKITLRKRRNRDAEKGVPHWCRERRAFPDRSTQSFARSVVWRLRPDLGAGTGNLYQRKRDQSRLRRAACGAPDRLQQGPYPNTCDGTCQRRYHVARRRK